MNRVSESLVYGAIFSHANAEVSNVLFYPPEFEPNTSSSNVWVQVYVELSDATTTAGNWMGEGIIKMFIQARKSAGNIYLGKSTAHELSKAFTKTAIDVDNNASVLQGYAIFDEPVSRPLGMDDGIIHHYWQIEYKVHTVT